MYDLHLWPCKCNGANLPRWSGYNTCTCTSVNMVCRCVQCILTTGLDPDLENDIIKQLVLILLWIR